MDIEEIIEIKKGMKVTVVKWTAGKDRSWIGDEFDVLSVQAPFVKVVNRHGILANHVITLNMDVLVLEEIKHEFTEANAQLLETAPRLLMVCENALRYLDDRNLGEPAELLKTELEFAIMNATGGKRDD